MDLFVMIVENFGFLRVVSIFYYGGMKWKLLVVLCDIVLYDVLLM